MSMVLVITGVSGSGKTEVGRALASHLGWTYHEADDFHPESNIVKMREGQPLCDENRQPWLEALRAQIEMDLAADHNAVVSCSGLKKVYRQMLRVQDNVKIVSLEASREVLEARLQQRKAHFFNPALLKSQIETWEVADDVDLRIDAHQPVNTIVDEIVTKLVK